MLGLKWNFLDFKLSPCSECSMLSSGQFPGIRILHVDVSEHSVSSVFIYSKILKLIHPSYQFAYEDGKYRVFRNVGT